MVKCDTSTPQKINSNQKDSISRHNLERLNLAQVPLQQDIDRQISDTDSTMEIHITGSKEYKFNEFNITLLIGQQDLQKQSLDIMSNMARQHEYVNLRRDIPTYNGKNMTLADLLLQMEK